MTVKRRNHGRNRHNRGKVQRSVVCDISGARVPKDKAIKRFQVRNLVDSSSLRDIREASVYEVFTVPKMYIKMHYSVGCAVHRRIVRGRAKAARKIREPPQRRPFKQQ